VKYGDKYVCFFACLFACISRKPVGQTTKFCVHVVCGRGSILLWWHCVMICTSGFMDDVTFSHNGRALRRVIVLSHWPHVATHVATQVAQLVASVKGLGHKLPNLLLNVCLSAACAATRRHVESHGYSLPMRKWNSYNDVIFSAAAIWL